MSSIDAKDTTFTFDGVVVQGILSYEFVQGQTQPILFKAISAPAAIAVPGQPDHGSCLLKLYRDTMDPGQQRLFASLQFRMTAPCVVTYANGSTQSFEAFCTSMPVTGSKAVDTPVNLSSCALRISGPIS